MGQEAERPKVGLQLYSLRQRAEQDLNAVLEDLPPMGYAGVAPSSFYGHTPRWFKNRAAELGLVIPSSHSPLPAGEDAERILHDHAELGSPVIYISFGKAQFESDQTVGAAAESLNQAAVLAKEYGLRVGYHNHWYEFASQLDGRPAYDLFVDRLDPALLLEVDIYWAQVGGADPRQVVASLGERVQHLHVKDGPADSVEAPMTAVGQGKVDIAGVLQANPHVRWHLVELDRCATDMTEAVRESCNWLVGNGFSQGRP